MTMGVGLRPNQDVYKNVCVVGGGSKTLQERDFGKCRKPHLATPENLSSDQFSYSTIPETGVGAKGTCLRSHSVLLVEHS